MKVLLEKKKEARRKVEDAIIERFGKSEIDGASGRLAKVSISKHPKPKIKDYKKFTGFVHKKKAFDLFQNRIAERALQDRIDAGERIPGIDFFEVVKVNVRKRKAK